MEKTWSKGLLGVLVISGLLSMVAFLAGLLELVALVIFPLLFVGIMYIADEEGSISITLDAPTKIKVGDEVEIKATMDVSRGAGVFLVELPTFEFFRITDGSNVRVIFKNFGHQREEVVYKILALRRGKFETDAVKYTYFPTMGIINTREGKVKVDFKMEVVPRVDILKKKGLRLNTSLLNPRAARSRVGPPSSDFDSIRNYIPGDPYKTINWKASARNAGKSLLVNQYEREGLHTFMFVLDRGHAMRAGTKEENPLEFGIGLILSFANLLLNYHYNVGSWIIQKSFAKDRTVILPGSGMEQYIRIRRQLIRMESRTFDPNEYQVDGEFVRVIKETSPIIFLITSVADANIFRLKRLCSTIAGMASRLVVVDVIPYGIYAKFSEFNIAGMMTESFTQRAKQRFYRELAGSARIMPWDPVKTSYGRAVGKMIKNLGR